VSKYEYEADYKYYKLSVEINSREILYKRQNVNAIILRAISNNSLLRLCSSNIFFGLKKIK